MLAELRRAVPRPDKIWRVFIASDNSMAMVVSFEFFGVDGSVARTYAPADTLPLWIKEKVAVLAMLSPTHPAVPGVGKKQDDTVYWVFDTREQDDDAGSQGQEETH